MGAGCTDSSAYSEPGPRPQIVSAAVASEAVNCAPADTGGACTVNVSVKFRLPDDHFVTTGIVRFQRDGSDEGVDRFYPVREVKYGLGPATDAEVSVDAVVPPNLVGTGVLFTFSVRIVTGLGEVSDASTLTITVTNIEKPKGDKNGGEATAQ